MASRLLSALVSGLITVLAGACGGGGIWGPEGYGDLVVRVADAPVDEALAIVIQFEAVDVQVSNALNPSYRHDRFLLKPAQQISMLDLSGGGTQMLIEIASLPAEKYNWIRLLIGAGTRATDSWIDTPTGRYPLHLPDSNEDGLVIHEAFYVPKDDALDLTVDFDLRQSIIPPSYPGGAYILDPVLRMVETDHAGTIEGTVDPGLAAGEGCIPVVYGFTGSGISPDDIDRQAPEPITESAVALDIGSGEFWYSLNWLPPGSYTVALTCQGDLDRPDRDDTPVVSFQPERDTTVVAGQATRVDL